jgi:hypothetical protein
VCFVWGGPDIVVSDYTLDDRGSIPAEEKVSSSLFVQNSYEANPASCTIGAVGTFPGGKARPGRDADHSHLPSAKVKNE